MAIKRDEVYRILDGERNYQDVKYPAVPNGDGTPGYSASPEGFLLVIEELSAQARAVVTQGSLPPLGNGAVVMEYIRKIGATAVRAMEQYGAPQRN